MRKLLIAVAAAGALSGAVAASASAAPLGEPGLNHALQAPSLVETVRLYCYNRYTGQFLHWGPCAHDRWRYRYRHHYHHWHHHHYHHYW